MLNTNLIEVQGTDLTSVPFSISISSPFILHFCVFLIFLFFIPFSAHGEIYTWKDRNGIRQYSNICPPQSKQKIQLFDEKPADKIKSPPLNSLPAFLRNHGKFRVLKVFDGDTIKVKNNNNLVIVVRFAGIDAPETRKKNVPGQAYGEEAKQMVKNRIAGKKIFMKTYGTGGYNRVLAEIFTEKGLNINLDLVRQGLAEVYRGRIPGGFDISPYLTAEAAAKRSHRGMWSLGSQYESPRQWRRQHPWKRF